MGGFAQIGDNQSRECEFGLRRWSEEEFHFCILCVLPLAEKGLAVMVSKIGTGERLRLIRGYQSQTDFAARIGLNQLDYARYESEESSPDLDLLIRLKFATGCSLDWLASGQEPGNVPAIDTEALASIIRSIECETPNLDPEKKANLILRLYEECRKSSSERHTD